MSSSKLSSKRSAPRVCPAINASRANPPANNRRGEKEQEREREVGCEETHRIALQLGREIALSTGEDPPKGLQTAGQTIVRRFYAPRRTREIRTLSVQEIASKFFVFQYACALFRRG